MKIVQAVFLFVFLLSTSNAFSQDLHIQEDVVYGHKAGMALTYDALVPPNANGAGVLFIVSGGWYSNWFPPVHIASMFGYLLDEGFTVFAVRHGSAPLFKVPDAVNDVTRAIRHIRLHSENFGVDPDRLGAIGFSAGGHLSLMLGLHSDLGDANSQDPVEQISSRVAAVVAFYPLTDLRGLAGPNDRVPAFDFEASLESSVSPVLFVTEDDPPVLLVHGDQDELVPISHSYQLKKAMNELRLEVAMHVMEGAAHGFEGQDHFTGQELSLAYFSKHLLND